MSPRFVVSEIEGFPIHPERLRHGALSPHAVEQLSVAVLDTAYCYEIVEQWNQEDYQGRPREESRRIIRDKAERLAGQLNRKYAVQPTKGTAD